MKSYTDLEQSKKLAEILPFESADMCYIKHSSSDNQNWEFNEDFPPMILGNVHINEITAETLPCWSLAALLIDLPNGIVMNKDSRNGRYHFSSKYVGTYVTADNPVDACVTMIEKLYELNCCDCEKKQWKPNMAQINALTAAIKQVDKGNADVLKGLKEKLMEL